LKRQLSFLNARLQIENAHAEGSRSAYNRELLLYSVDGKTRVPSTNLEIRNLFEVVVIRGVYAIDRLNANILAGTNIIVPEKKGNASL
jgi:hypothetical protein